MKYLTRKKKEDTIPP